MNILPSLSSHFIPARPPSLLSTPCFNSLPLSTVGTNPPWIKFPPHPICTLGFPITATDQEAVSAVEFEEFVEKDWSFLEFKDANSDGEHMRKIDRIISAGSIKETSKVLVSIGSEAFVDKIVYSSPCEQLLVVHESLLVLACIKERHDKVKCWQGEVIDLHEKWSGFDVLYLYFLPALSFELDQVLEALARRCLPGARVVMSHPHGKEVVEEQQQQYPDVVVSNLPDKMTLHNTAANHCFQVLEFVDEPAFYLAVMRFNDSYGCR